LDVPGTDIEVPVPSGEILVTAATTAFVSVAATLSATALFKYLVTLLKPVFKQAWSKMDPTYVASILSGTLATFSITREKNK
jgi:hypothetical protein